MWTRRLGFILLLLAGIFFLALPQLGTEMQVLAGAPAFKPSALTHTYLPIITYFDSLSRSPLWRFGADKVRLPFSAYNPADLAHLRLSWYVDFGATIDPETTNGMEYMPMVRMKQLKLASNGTQTECCVGCSYVVPATYVVHPSLSVIQSMAVAQKGKTWIVGNEMERIDWLGPDGVSCASQDEMLPEVYAHAYHDVYSALKSADPTAQVAMGALVEPSSLRIEWLNRVWAEYTSRYGGTMPVDVWDIHVYVYREKALPPDNYGAGIPAGLSETVGNLFQIRDNKDFTKASPMIVAWRTWMRDHGQQNKPLMTPEYGVAYPDWLQDPPGVPTFLPNQIRDSYMYPSFNYFLNHTDPSIGFPADGNRLVQRWAWWSNDYDDGQCDPGDPNYYLSNSGALFFSGLGPSSGLNTCNFPARGLSQFGTYFTTYVQALPPGSAKPYAPVRSPSAPIQSSSPTSSANAAANQAVLKDAPATVPCSDSPAVRTRFLQSLPSRSTPEGQQAWLMALSSLTPGTHICMP